MGFRELVIELNCLLYRGLDLRSRLMVGEQAEVRCELIAAGKSGICRRVTRVLGYGFLEILQALGRAFLVTFVEEIIRSEIGLMGFGIRCRFTFQPVPHLRRELDSHLTGDGLRYFALQT